MHHFQTFTRSEMSLQAIERAFVVAIVQRGDYPMSDVRGAGLDSDQTWINTTQNAAQRFLKSFRHWTSQIDYLFSPT